MVRRSESRWLHSLVLLIVGSLFTIALPGCGGCWSSDDSAQNKTEEEKKKEKEKKKKKSEKPVEDFTLGRILAQPAEVRKGSPEINYVKRGHWVTATQQMRANNADVQAELRSTTADSSGNPFDIERTKYQMSFAVSAPLPKGRAKQFESLFFVPRQKVDARPASLRNELVPQRGGYQLQVESSPISAMDEWQYIFLVLSTRTSAYNVYGVGETFSPSVDSFGTSDQNITYYRTLKPLIDKTVPLPTNSLAWTHLAVILWDDLDPSKLTPGQQEAMLDWLHWGGHLLVSGPNSLDKLKGSFLEPYLPATNKGSKNLTQESFEAINKHWSLRTRERHNVPRDLQIIKEIAGMELELAPHGQFVDHTGELVAAGRVGQGRIVITGFSLASGAFQKWANFDGFLNGALLLRPGRQFLKTVDEQNNVMGSLTTWNDPDLSGIKEVVWSIKTSQMSGKDYRRDARLVSNMRFFSRDMGFAPGDENLHPYKPADLLLNSIDPDFYSGMASMQFHSTALERGPEDDERFGGYLAVPAAGVGSWNDFSGVANAARKHLNDAAGISIPQADFVAKVLGVYLLVLVPLNWLLFRLMRRVEWAWIAAPVIAIVGAVTVVRLAQLDIGFVRSRTEIDVVEMHAGYSRAHVSRYIALYTSLSTNYDLTFEDAAALAQPLAGATERSARAPLERAFQVQFRQESNLELSGFNVVSNSTGLIHAEQMRDMGGKLELLGSNSEGWRLKNGTELLLKDVGVLWRTSDKIAMTFYIAELRPGTTIPLRFKESDSLWVHEWEQSGILSAVNENATVSGDLRLGRFAQLAAQQLQLFPGEMRLIAWTDKEVDGIAYSPDAPQVTGRSFVLAHLRRGKLPPPEKDFNVRQDVALNQQEGSVPLPDDTNSSDTNAAPTP